MATINQKSIGLRIKTVRESKKMSQFQLYKRTGISTTQISAYENGKRNIGLGTIAKIATALNVPIDELFYGQQHLKPITSANNEGELIVRCISALFDCQVIRSLPHERARRYSYDGLDTNYRIGFSEHVDILDDLVRALTDFENKSDTFPDPNGFKEQLLASAAKRINDRLERKAK